MDMTMCCTVTANLNSVDTDQRIAVASLDVLADNLYIFLTISSLSSQRNYFFSVF